MPTPFKTWTVLPHGNLIALDDNLLTVQGAFPMPLAEASRRMTVARLTNGRLVVYSAIALDEAEMQELERFGTPTYLIVPNDLHRMDAKIWKERYPALVVVTPAKTRARVEEVVRVDASQLDFADPRVRYMTVPGTDEREAALLVETSSGTTLVVNDIIFNLANRPGFGGWLLKVLKITGDQPHLPPVVKMREVKDDAALRGQLEAWSRMPSLNRVIPSHGDIIERDAPEVLGRIARELAA